MWSVKCGVGSGNCGVQRVECEVWSAKCGVECGMLSVDVKSGVWSVACNVWSIKCGV